MILSDLKGAKTDKVFFISYMRYETAIIIEGSISCSDLGGYTSESARLSLMSSK
tara:strand:- start:209 stop:370 length:162 start_codon:yes stop_codon:yes gene_type:complete